MVMDFLRRSVRRAAAERGLYLSVTTLLALGIGASTTVFSVVDATVLRPLPFPEPEELVFLTATLEGSDGEIQNFLVSPANYVVMRDRSTAFRAVEAIRASAFDLLADGEPVQVSGAEVTPGFFEALRATPVAGRLLTETDVDDAVAVLGEGAWARHFGRDPGVVGRTVDLGSVPTRIVGVLPDHLALPRETEVWRTFRPEDVRERDQHGGGLQVIGRLASDVALSTAQADMDRIAGRLRELYPRGNSERGIEVQDLKDSFVEDTEGALRALLASVLIFMAIACANVSGLLLLRVRRRASDTALRLALGAPRSRLLAGALLEGVGMSAVGTGAGLALAAVAVPRLHGVLTVVPPGADPSALDPRVLAAAAILGAGTAVAFALGPALVAAAQAPDAFLGRGRGGTASRGQRRLQQATVGLQVALGVLLVVTATATLGRFLDLTGTRPGYSGTDAVVLRVGASSARYPGFAERSAFFFGLSERFRSIPGV
ncbi:MAG: hypothetical protein GWM92_09335, partial [Gemmatimonadetes bacterium]|nr:hypothetical protein [Gemmatimonadota bacterium]NIR78859.1 hypothetical protein [Gemmatimonadota bacterium]NIT87498.1 hypothetical protein [Gemmatimonadota bacterium]NIU31367.1 hypothetical protein [Gemmatimonadota bacterium]NIU36044.1 hypothetical protein [Gemmatimonadota bacterium]